MVLETGPQAHSWEQWVSTFAPAIQQLILHASQPATAHQITVEGNTDAKIVIGSVSIQHLSCNHIILQYSGVEQGTKTSQHKTFYTITKIESQLAKQKVKALPVDSKTSNDFNEMLLL